MSPSVKAILFDLSGVLYEGSRPVQGASTLIQNVREQKLVLRFVTNTATKPWSRIINDLAAMDITVTPDELYTAPKAARSYIEARHLHPFCLIHQAIKEEFSDLDQGKPDCVLLGDARDDLTYESLNKAFRLCKQGAPLIGIGLNKYFRDDDGLKLDAGAFIHALQWAADTEPVIMGKPSPEFFREVVSSTGFDPAECLMVGDDVIADVKGAIEAGLQGCLVRTGKYQPDDECKLDGLPAVVLDSVTRLSI